LLVGLTVYLFGSLLVTYEKNHDTFYKNADRIFTVGAIISPAANIGIIESEGIPTALAPYILADVPEVEEVARTMIREFLLTIDSIKCRCFHFVGLINLRQII